MAADKKPLLPTRSAGKAKVKTPVSRFDKGAQIPQSEQSTANQAVLDYRYETIPAAALRKLARVNGNVGSSVFSFVEIAKSGYRIRGYTTNTQDFNYQAVEAAKSVLSMMDTVYNYQRGYADVLTLDALVEVLLREAALTSFVGTELVLDKARMPERLISIPHETIIWKSRGDGTKYPVQQGLITGGEEVELDTATVWTAEVHKDQMRAYVTPMLEPAIDSATYYQEFVEDMRRSVRQGGHSRLVITLNAEMVIAAAPDEAKNDPAKMKAFMESQLSAVENVVKSMEPEDALVTYDSVDADLKQAKSVKKDYTELLTAISGMLATSLKSHPSILGLRLQGSQSLSNTESMVFLKIAKAIQRPVADVLSRALTLAVRLLGVDAYIKFEFNPINLRPEDELEAYRTMRQDRLLQLLSLGFLSDDEAAEELGTGKRPANAPQLSGTMFHQKDNTLADDVKGAPRDPQGEALEPDSPNRAGGSSQ